MFLPIDGILVLAVAAIIGQKLPRAFAGAQPDSTHRGAWNARLICRVDGLTCRFLFWFSHVILPPSQIGDKLFEVSSSLAETG